MVGLALSFSLRKVFVETFDMETHTEEDYSSDFYCLRTLLLSCCMWPASRVMF